MRFLKFMTHHAIHDTDDILVKLTLSVKTFNQYTSQEITDREQNTVVLYKLTLERYIFQIMEQAL